MHPVLNAEHLIAQPSNKTMLQAGAGGALMGATLPATEEAETAVPATIKGLKKLSAAYPKTSLVIKGLLLNKAIQSFGKTSLGAAIENSIGIKGLLDLIR